MIKKIATMRPLQLKTVVSEKTYMKLRVLVPNQNKKNDGLLPLVKKMPVVANFKPKNVEIWVVPSGIKGVQVINIYIT